MDLVIRRTSDLRLPVGSRIALPIVGVAGAGSAQVVWRVTCPALGHDVVVKPCSSKASASDVRLSLSGAEWRAVQEASLLWRLQSCPSVVRVLWSADWHRGGHLVPGLVVAMPVYREISNFCAEACPTLEMRCQWAQQLSAALQALHARRFLHRDVSPGNILLSLDGSAAFLADFGCAERECDDAENAEGRAVYRFVGTRLFASEEAVSERLPPAREDDWVALLYSVHWSDPKCRRWGRDLRRRPSLDQVCAADPAAAVVRAAWAHRLDKTEQR